MGVLSYINDNMPDRVLEPGEIVAEAVLMYRVVRIDNEDTLLERCDYIMTAGCGRVMAQGIVYEVQEDWTYERAELKLGGDDSEE